MADISITAANVVLVSGPQETITAGGTITAGMPVYRDASDSNKAKPARANSASTDDVYGIALASASAGQPLVVARPGATVNMGATLSLGKIYVLSAGAAGGVAPADDLVATNFVTVLGVAVTTANLYFNPIVSSVAAAADVA